MSPRLKLSAIAMGAVVFLAGCSAMAPMSHDKKSPVTSDSVHKLAEGLAGWDEPSVITEGVASVVLVTPQSLPELLKNRKVDLELEPGAKISDVVAILGRLGVPTIIADAAAADRTFYLPRYSGTLGGLISALSRATDTWFTWHEGTVVVSALEKISVSIPQESDFADELGKGLTSLGLTGSSVSWQAGMASMELTPTQFGKVRTYLERFTSNAAVVTMQIAVVTVALTHDVKQGIDWDQLSIAAQPMGTSADLATWRNGKTPSVTTGADASTGTTTGTTTDTTPAANVAPKAAAATGTASALGEALARGDTGAAVKTAAVTALSLAAGNLSAAVFMDRFSFQGMFGYLQKYGTTETKQNVVLKTVTGNKVSFKSITEVPYIASVSVTNTANTTAGSSTGSTTTAKAEDGIKVELLPTYDAAANSVSITLDLSIKSVLAFNELSAGNQIGTLTQPSTADRSFTDKLRVRPGQTVVVGGLTYDSVGDERGAPLYLQKTPLESQSLKVTRNTTFIVIRPTVTRLGQVLAAESGQSLDLLPTAADPNDSKVAHTKKGKSK